MKNTCRTWVLLALFASCDDASEDTDSGPARGLDAATPADAGSLPVNPDMGADAERSPSDAAEVEADTDVEDAAVADAAPMAPDAGPPDGPRLLWADEFEGAFGEPIDARKWVHDVGGHGWGNNQLEFDTDRTDNAALDGRGHLVITAREEDYQGRQYTSARIKTQGLFAQQYGRFEARIRLPRGQGIWPAFWLLGSNITEVSWPQCGEIDVMEFRGQNEGQSTGALHGPGYSAGASLYAAYDAGESLSDDFHLFAVEWTASGIRWLVDENEFHRVTPDDLPPGTEWVYDAPFFIILNVAVGGDYVGSPDASTVFPQEMLVDYVRVYEIEGEAPPPAAVGPGDRLSLGIFYEGPARETVPIDDVRTHFYVYEDTFSLQAEFGEAREGAQSDRIALTGGDWWGGGVHWFDPRDLSAWGSVHLSLKADAPSFAGLELTMGSAGDRRGGVRLADYGFAPDGAWHDLEIPLAAFAEAGADLSQVNTPFVFAGGAGAAGESLLVDAVYLRGPD